MNRERHDLVIFSLVELSVGYRTLQLLATYIIVLLLVRLARFCLTFLANLDTFIGLLFRGIVI